MELIPWAGCTACALLAVSGYVRMARTEGGWGEAAGWTAPLVFTSAALLLLVAFGTLALLPWLLLALVPLAVVAWRSARVWRITAGLPESGRGKATATVLSLLAARIGNALWNAREDIRGLVPRVRRAAPVAQAAPESRGDRSAGGPQRWAAAARARHVPPLMEDPYLGAHPYPADVATSLELDRVPVPPHWDRTAQVIGDFDPEDDDDTQGHLAGEAAGVLGVAAAVENRAEHLAFAVGLDPAIIEAHYDIAEGFAELATRYALLVRRDHLVMGDLREYRDQGGVIPHDGRRYMNAGDPRLDGDQTA
jgi:hypothetical protein